VEGKGIVCALCRDRGSHFWHPRKAGGNIDPHRLTQAGRALRELGGQMIPAYSPQARGRSERNFGTWQGRLPQELRLRGIRSREAANRFLREHYMAEFNARFQVPAAQRGSAFVRRSSRHLTLIFALQFERTVNRDNAVSIHNLRLQIEPVRWRATLAGRSVTVHQHLDGTYTITCGPQRIGHYRAEGAAGQRKKRRATSCGKDAPWKSPKPDFSTSLGNPANPAGFPLSHSYGCYWVNLKPDISCATKTEHFNSLPTESDMKSDTEIGCCPFCRACQAGNVA